MKTIVLSFHSEEMEGIMNVRSEGGKKDENEQK